jgi:predicted DNA-binding protein YlxM (UPF0122 family)
MTSHMMKIDRAAANLRFDTQRARYLYLAKLGYSQAEIADAYGVSKRRVWQAIHSVATPKEQGKLERYRVRAPVRRA